MKSISVICGLGMTAIGTTLLGAWPEMEAQASTPDHLREQDGAGAREIFFNGRIFRAAGEHKCWSSRSVGHTCFIHGVNFTSCDDAFRSLQADDCCPGSDGGGSSIEFSLNQCTMYN